MPEPDNISLSEQRLIENLLKVQAGILPFLEYMKLPRWKRILFRKKFSPDQKY